MIPAEKVQVVEIGTPMGFLIEQVLSSKDISPMAHGQVEEVEVVDGVVIQVKLLTNSYLVMTNIHKSKPI